MDRHGGRATTRLGGGVLSGTDAWSREARWVRERATCLGLALDEEQLAPQDTHDLQTLHVSLHSPRSGPMGTRWMVLRRLRAQCCGTRAPRLMWPMG
jgi:hypothetical protein